MRVFLCFCAIHAFNFFVHSAPSSSKGNFDEDSFAQLLKSLETNTTQDQEDERWIAVQRMGIIEDEIDKKKKLDDKQSIEELVHAFETMVWPRILEKSMKIYENINDWSNKVAEEEYQQELIKSVSRIRYKAGKRRCLADDEAYYPANGKCYKVGRQEPRNNPCPSKRDNAFYEALDNIGVCDCMKDERNLVFYPENGQCFPLFQQEPCEENEWLVFHRGVPSCRTVPLNCMADGKHAYGNPSGLSDMSQCWALGVQGPCPSDQVVQITQDGNLTCSSVSNAENDKENIAPVVRLPSCNAGSFRNLFNLCKVVI